MAQEYERRIGRKEAAQYLTERGYRIAHATLAKLACLGGGPPISELRAQAVVSRG
jgi:hypothetical protein